MPYMSCFFRILTITVLASSAAHRVSAAAYSKSSARTPVYGYKIVNTYPHDEEAFTQGLAFDNGFLYEGTGGYGRSTLRKVKLETAEVLQTHSLRARFFGEGMTVFRNKIIQLTWRSRTGFVYDKNSFRPLRAFNCPGEGWGITHDGKRLIISNGKSTLRFLDPNSFETLAQLEVRDNNVPVTGLNELEYVRDRIYANIWGKDRIAIIDPKNGNVVAWIDLKGLLGLKDRRHMLAVLNGIAYDEKRDRLFVTGKSWPKLFEIKLTAPVD